MGIAHKSKVNVPSLAFSVNSVAHISSLLSFGPYSCASTVNATVGGWPSGSIVCSTPMLFPNFNVIRGNIMYLFEFFGTNRPVPRSLT